MSQATKKLHRYLFNAFYEWAMEYIGRVDILVLLDGLDDPMLNKYKTGSNSIILNIAMSAVRDLHITDTHVCFYCRFHGVESYQSIPFTNILGIRGEHGVIHMVQVIPLHLSQSMTDNQPKPLKEELSDRKSDNTQVKGSVDPTPKKPPHRRPTLTIVK